MRFPPARMLCLLSLALLPRLFAAKESTAIPPEPEAPAHAPSKSDAKDAQIRKDWAQFHAAHAQWENSLTAAQLLELKNERAHKEKASGSRKKHETDTRLPEPGDGYSWLEAASQRKLEPDLIASLQANKVAFGPATKQSFAPYLGGPVFITSDSQLNGFQVLLEDSVRELELRHALGLKAKLEELLARARELPAKEKIMDPVRAARALRHLQLVLGPAMLLSGSSVEVFDPELRTEIEAQATLLRQASSTSLPTWLAPADPESLMAIDYGRCRPVSLYAENPRLAAYFAAIRWLQLVPLRAAREHEFDAMVLASLSLKGNWSHENNLGNWFTSLTEFFGRGDDPGPVQLCEALDNQWPRNAGSFDSSSVSVRNTLAKAFIEKGYYEINSDLRASRTGPETFATLSFRIVPAVKLPDARLFQQLLDAGQKPTGLGVAGMLGSSFALAQLEPAQRTIVEKNGPWNPPQTRNGVAQPIGVYENYLNTLGALFLPAEQAAPDFMRSPFWALKNCQTALAGWAQMRHTFTLQAKMNIYYFGLVSVPPGFVEPNPEFFHRFAHLITQTHDALEAAACFSPDPQVRSEEFLQQAREVRKLLARFLSEPEYGNTHEFKRSLDSATNTGLGLGLKRRPIKKQEDTIRFLEELIGLLERKGTTDEPKLSGKIDPEDSLANRWKALERISLTLETLAHKQLRGVAWSRDEEQFLKLYGERMAGIMGYAGNSWLTPRDDAPRWAEVCAFPQEGKSLAVGIGRPRILYVLYPWNGMEILCTGSVMQYYEYDADQRLTDLEWLKLLDSPKAPPLPVWMAPYASPPGLPTKDH